MALLVADGSGGDHAQPDCFRQAFKTVIAGQNHGLKDDTNLGISTESI